MREIPRKITIFNKLIVIVLVVFLVLLGLMLLPPSLSNKFVDSTSSGRSIRTGNTNINVTIIGSFSPGYLGDQNKEFYIAVNETYNGEYYDHIDPIPEGNIHWRSLWNVKLRSLEFYQNNNLVSPIEWDEQRQVPDNNNGAGWLIRDNFNFYNNVSNNWMFRFNVSAYGIKTGMYELRLKFEYQILSNYSSAGNRYNYTDINGQFVVTEIESVPFEVRSCMSSDLIVTAVDENNIVINNGRFFAGAENQKMRIIFDKDYPGASLENVRVNFIPPSFIEMYGNNVVEPMNVVSINSLTSLTPFYWRININNSVLPGVYSGTDVAGYIYYEYIRGDNQVYVLENFDIHPLDFIVDYTPLIVPPPTNGMLGEVMANQIITQGTAETQLLVNFENDGNVDLFDITLGLALGDSFIQAPYYYNAGASDLKTEVVLSDRSIDYLPINGEAIATFNLSLFNNLPKGKYLIPVMYTAWYYNNGTLGDPTGIIKTTEADFNTIRATRNLQPLDTLAHIAVAIDDPQPHITLQSTALGRYYAGQTNQVISLTLNNFELYPFHNVTLLIPTGEDNPFEKKGVNQSTEYLTDYFFQTLPAGSQNFSFSTTFNIFADVKSDANGFYSVPVIVRGWDVFNDYFEFETSLDVSIIPQLPEFVVVNTINSKVTPGKNFTIGVTLKNVGASYAKNLEVLFIGSSGVANTFYPAGSGVFTVGDLPPGAQVEVIFNATANANLTIGKDYEVYLKLKFEDELGNIYGFNDNAQVSFNIRTTGKPLLDISEIFLVTRIDAPNIKPGSKFDLTIRILNIGNLIINDSDAKLVSSSNLFKISDNNIPAQGKGSPGYFDVNQEKSLKYEIMVAKSVEYGKMYELHLFIRYTDDTGEVKDYDSSTWLPITLRIQDEEPADEEDRANWELVSVGILILIAAIIFVFWLGHVIKKSNLGIAPLREEQRERPMEEAFDEEEAAEPEEKEEEVEEEEVGEEEELKKEEEKVEGEISKEEKKEPEKPGPAPAAVKSAPSPESAPPSTATPKKVGPVTPVKITAPVKDKKKD